MKLKKLSKLRKLNCLVAAIEAASRGIMRGDNSRKTAHQEVLFFAKIYGLKEPDIEELEGLTLGEIIETMEKVRLPFDPHMTGNIDLSKYRELSEARQIVMQDRIDAVEL